MLRSSGYFFEKIKPRIAKSGEVWYDQKKIIGSGGVWKQQIKSENFGKEQE